MLYSALVWVILRTESKTPYVAAIVPDHPAADSRGRVYLHRIVAENHLGRLLKSNEHVHHINEIKTDNRWENLEVKEAKKHISEHKSTGVTVVKVECAWCGKEFDRQPRLMNGERVFCSHSHSGKFYGMLRGGINGA